MAAWTLTRSGAQLSAELQAAGVSAMPVMGPCDHHADEHLADRGFIVTLHHPEVGDERHVGTPVRMSRLRQRVSASSLCLGADTVDVLGGVLGLSSAEIDEHATAGILS